MDQLLRVQNFTVSADGFGAGEQQSLERPFGHAEPSDFLAWAGATASWPNRTDPGGSRGLDDCFTRDFSHNIGAEIMGRNKFGPQRGLWKDEEWKGWWGDEPPFHTPSSCWAAACGGRRRSSTTASTATRWPARVASSITCCGAAEEDSALYLGVVFFLFGFGTKQQHLGPGETRTCPSCQNTTQWARVREFKQLTVFFVPVARWKRRQLEQCGVCGTAVEP